MSRRVHHQGPAREQGVALVVALLVILLCTIVVVAVLQLATHSAQRSGLTRDRNAALNAAEAGIQAELSLIADGTCPTSAGAPTPLPDQQLPSESYVIQVPLQCTVNGSAVIAATGYVPNTTTPTATVTMVAHINRSQGAPVSGGARGNYDFPDALFTDGPLTATAGTLNLYGSGGSVPNITADGPITIGGAGSTGSQLGGAINGESSVSVMASQIGSQVTGTNVALAGPATGMTVLGGIGASGNLSLTNVNVNGTALYGGSYSHSGTVTGTVSSGGSILPLARPLGTFSNIPGDIGATLGVGTTPTASCPPTSTAWDSSFYDIASSCPATAPSTYSPTSSNRNTVIVVQGAFNVTVPPTPVGGQLYIVDVGGGSADSLTITGSGSTLPVFAYTDGPLTLAGTLVGQFVGHSIAISGASTTVTFAPPATPMPDIAFPPGYTTPNLGAANGYVSTIAFEYQCPGTTAC